MLAACAGSEQDKQDLKAFLLALRGPLPDIRMEDWVRPVAAAEGLDGEALFNGKATCINCHQADGMGVPGGQFPRARRRRQLCGRNHHPWAQWQNQRSRQGVQCDHASGWHPAKSQRRRDRGRRKLRAQCLGQSSRRCDGADCQAEKIA